MVAFLEARGHAVSVCSDARAFTRAWKPSFPQCVLCTLDPGGDGLAVLAWLHGRGGGVPVVGLVSSARVSTIVAAMRLGAENVLERPFSEGELLDALQVAWLRGRDEDRSRAEDLLARLSPREREVLDLVVKGMTSKQIALRLGLSKKTVDVHRGHVLHKLEANCVVDLVRIHTLRRGAAARIAPA
jgi:FixJ family two-component response regulator